MKLEKRIEIIGNKKIGIFDKNSDEMNEDELKGFQDDLEQFRRESQRGLKNLQSSTPLPEVQPVSNNALSPERIDFAERLARRPIV